MAGYLPDGVTQADIDRAGEDPYAPRCEKCKEDPCECCKRCSAGPLEACEPWCGLQESDEDVRETMPNPIIDETDIDNEGRGTGPELGCLYCHETSVTRWGITSTYMLAALNCRECLETLVTVWI